jgi:pimeloyl-ACP methyl ester carboxylesterase
MTTTQTENARRLHSLILLLVATLLLSACSSSAFALRSEDRIPGLAERKAAGLATPSQFIAVNVADAGIAADGYDAPVRMMVERKGALRAERGIVLLHGLFGTRGTWRFCTGELAQGAACYVVDMPGCGDSGKPDPDAIGEAFYSAESLAGCLGATLDAILARPDAPKRLTLVGWSFGGMVTLRLLGHPRLRARYASALDRVDRAVLVAPADVAVHKQDPEWQEIATLTGAYVALGQALGMLEPTVKQGLYESAIDPTSRPAEMVDEGIAVLTNEGSRRALQAMVKQAVPWHANGRPDWERMAATEQYYANVDVPCLLIWGRCDETLPVAVGYKLLHQLPQATLRVVPRCTHMVPYEAPGRFAALVTAFNGSATAEVAGPVVAELPATEPRLEAAVTERAGTVVAARP